MRFMLPVEILYYWARLATHGESAAHHKECVKMGGADGRTRTGDNRITSAGLYQLSYVGLKKRLLAERAVGPSISLATLRMTRDVPRTYAS